jgi:Flp pilus assembly protein TadG
MKRGQQGQVLIIFALTAMFFVGIVAISVDYGFLVDQHRNLQAFADEAASAGALQLPLGPTLSDRTNARKVAFQYLRDGLLDGSTQTISSGGFTCQPSGPAVDFTQDIDNCALPAALGNYTISIDTPANKLSVTVPNQYWTISVAVTGQVGNALAGLLGAQKSQASASAVALNNHDQNFPDAVYADGCITTGNSLETISGQVYIDRCTIQPQSSGASAVCVENALNSAGNILYGPQAQQPAQILQNQSLPTCTAAAGGQVITMGAVGNTTQALPAMVPPALPPSGNCWWTSCNVDAQATNTCGKMFPQQLPAQCFSPGSYRTIGPISNNLNPGVYYITGDSTCTNNSSLVLGLLNTTQPCAGALFKDNTLNANWPDVSGKCWGSPNTPATGSFTSPCLNGFSFDPTTPTDPQCPPVATLNPPTFALTGLATGGFLDNALGALGTDYWVAVTATGGNGETSGTEQKVNVNSLHSGKGSITVAITALPGATGYKVYGPSTTSGLSEILSAPPNPTMPLSATTLSTTLQNAQPGSGPVVPSANTSGNTPLPPPSFTLADIANSASSLAAGTYNVRVTGQNSYGETLSSLKTIGPIAAKDSIGVSITTQPGDTGYWIYGPTTTDGQELSYSSAASPTVVQPNPLTSQTPQYQLTGPATGTETFPQTINRSGCPSNGFFNIPNRPDEYDGVTFVLKNNASICLNVQGGMPCAGSNGVGSYTPTVMFGPSYSTAGQCNAANGDGVYPVYSYGTGVISAQGVATKLDMTGTLYAPGMGLQITQNAQFSLYGQMVIGQMTIQTGNTKNPDVYYGGNCLAILSAGVRILQ